ncbi:MAG: isoprenyl transferase [Methylococcaceae bacterium]|jgi:undecaprenyl diphosphate synthase
MSVERLNLAAPRHIAIIMDGNGRWAQKRFLPRAVGHHAGVKAVRKIVEFCAADSTCEVLSLFAFSSENWNRPESEVSILMALFLTTLQSEIDKLHKNNIRLCFIGDRTAFDSALQQKMNEGEQKTKDNTALTLVIAANYGGRWDMAQACKAISERVAAGELSSHDINETVINKHLSLSDFPEPDLFIRTGGEQRVSNFMLWQLAYTELYFTPILWPDFNQAALQEAITSFQSRQRRFGYTGDQIATIANP